MESPQPMREHAASRRYFIVAVLTVALFVVVGCAPIASAVGGQPPALVPAPNAASLGVTAPGGLAVQQAADVPVGRILFVRDGNLWLWQAGNSRQFSVGITWSQPTFSPDGREVAYVYWTANFSDVFVMASDGSNSRRLTRGQSASLQDNSWSMRPAWSPDGERLAFVSDATSNLNQVWIMGKDGGSRRQVTSEAQGISWADSISWEPNGTRLAVTAAPSMRDPSHIYLIDVATGAFEKLTNQTNGAFDPAWSPDGTAIALIGRTSARGALTIRSLDGSKVATFDKLPYLRSPTWSPDGKSIAFLSGQGGTFEIWIVSVQATATGFEIGEPRPLTRDAAIDPASGLTWAP